MGLELAMARTSLMAMATTHLLMDIGRDRTPLTLPSIARRRHQSTSLAAS